MPNRYTINLSEDERQELEKMIAQLSRPLTSVASKGEYEYVSRFEAKQSRRNIGAVDDDDEFVLRFYGRWGLVLNKMARELAGSQLPAISAVTAINNIRIFRNKFSLSNPDSINKNQIPMGSRKALEIMDDLKKYSCMLYRSFQSRIDTVIENNSYKFPPENKRYLYRITRAKKYVYVPLQEALSGSGYTNLLIEPNDLVMDHAFLSTASEASTVLYRYSSIASPSNKSASNRNPMSPDEEELLFAIENNEFLESINISGFKLGRSQKLEGLTSGEFLIQREAKFRVLAIQATPPPRQRLTAWPRVVVLRPEDANSISAGSTIKNIFDGIPYIV